MAQVAAVQGTGFFSPFLFLFLSFSFCLFLPLLPPLLPLLDQVCLLSLIFDLGLTHDLSAKFSRMALAEEPFPSVSPKVGRYSIAVDCTHHL